MEQELNIFMVSVFAFVLLIYIAFFCYIYSTKKDMNLRSFYFVIENIYNKNLPIKESYEQLNLDYEKHCQEVKNIGFTNILDLLETMIYYYDSRTDKFFERFLKVNKKDEIRNFLMELYNYVKLELPFISVPFKEASLMTTLKKAIDINDSVLGINTLMQLSTEVESKEKSIRKQRKINQLSMIVSGIGVFLTIFFGIVSLISLF